MGYDETHAWTASAAAYGNIVRRVDDDDDATFCCKNVN